MAREVILREIPTVKTTLLRRGNKNNIIFQKIILLVTGRSSYFKINYVAGIVTVMSLTKNLR